MFSQYAKKCTSIYLDTRQRIKTKSIGKPYTKQSNKSVSLLCRLSGTFCRYSGPFIPFVPDAVHRESRPASPVKAYHSLNKRLVNILNYWYRTRIFIFPADLYRKLCISSSLIKKLVTKFDNMLRCLFIFNVITKKSMHSGFIFHCSWIFKS